MDMTTGPDGYTYIVTDTALYTFDSRDAADGLDPLDVDEFGGWAGADWGIDAEMVAGYLYVGASSGVHIFSLDDPENPQEVAYTPSYSPVLDMASLENALYLADGQGITVLDVSDPAAPAEVKRVSLGSKLALKVGVDEETRGLLVLTLATLERFSVQANPVNPVFSKRRSLLGALMTEMKVDGRWAYFNGLLSTDTVFWDGLNLVKKGTHDLRDWTDGRALRDGMAERVQPLQNKYEVWAE